MLRRTKNKKGFTLIELAIVLAVASLLFAGLWRLMAAGSTQMRDQAVADQHKQLIAAVKAYLASTQGTALLTSAPAAATFSLQLPELYANCSTQLPAEQNGFCDYLPIGFQDNTKNAYDQKYSIGVRKDNQPAGTAPTTYSFMIGTYSFMIGTEDGDIIPDSSGGRIASLIGSDGGFVYEGNVCGGVGYACGAYGTWSALPGTYGLVIVAGHVASRTFMSNASVGEQPWLARKDIDGDLDPLSPGEFNSLSTNIALQGNILYGTATQTVTAGGSVVANYEGEIDRLSKITLGRHEKKDGSIWPQLVINTPCNPEEHAQGEDSTGYTCDWAVQVDGPGVFNGLLQANRLYATQFIYNTSLGPSDKRLKQNIFPIKGALEKISKIKGYSFEMKNGGAKKYGVISQEVEKVFPEIVAPIEGEYKGIDYLGLIGPLIAAVRELKEENDVLKVRLEEISKKVEDRTEEN